MLKNRPIDKLELELKEILDGEIKIDTYNLRIVFYERVIKKQADFKNVLEELKDIEDFKEFKELVKYKLDIYSRYLKLLEDRETINLLKTTYQGSGGEPIYISDDEIYFKVYDDNNIHYIGSNPDLDPIGDVKNLKEYKHTRFKLIKEDLKMNKINEILELDRHIHNTNINDLQGKEYQKALKSEYNQTLREDILEYLADYNRNLLEYIDDEIYINKPDLLEYTDGISNDYSHHVNISIVIDNLLEEKQAIASDGYHTIHHIIHGTDDKILVNYYGWQIVIIDYTEDSPTFTTDDGVVHDLNDFLRL